MDAELQALLTEFIEKVGLLRRDLKHKGDLDKYEARMARVEQKFSSLAEAISRTDPTYAMALRTAWQFPARSLAFRNAEHRKGDKGDKGDKRDQGEGGRGNGEGDSRGQGAGEEGED